MASCMKSNALMSKWPRETPCDKDQKCLPYQLKDVNPELSPAIAWKPPSPSEPEVQEGLWPHLPRQMPQPKSSKAIAGILPIDTVR